MPTSLVLALLLLAPALVERVLAVVGGRPVLLSETRALQEVRGVAPDAALDLMVDETLMYDQASRTPQAAVRPDEVESARDALYSKRPELRSLVAPADLARLLKRQISILKYVDFRFRPQVRPTDEELKQAYDAEYANRPEAPVLETVAEALRDRLVRRELDLKVEAWIKELRSSTEIRLVSP
jgi:hypothetical protein